MSLDQLDTPLRMTWTLGQDDLEISEVMLLAEQVAASGLFFLTLQGAFCTFERLPDLLGRLVQAGIQVSLVVDPDLGCDHLTAELPVSQFLVDCTELVSGDGLDQVMLEAVVSRLAQAGITPALQLVPLQDNLVRLSELFDFASREGVERVVLPNTPLVDDVDGKLSSRLLRDHDIMAFRQLWAGLKATPKPKELVVHDLFLWEILCPEQGREHYSGCQAGNSLSHLDRSGILYPCSAWVQPLGCLLHETVQNVWQKAGRSAVLEQISKIPSGCHDCGSWDSCYGGCRGLAKSFGQKNGGRDLMCPDRR